MQEIPNGIGRREFPGRGLAASVAASLSVSAEAQIGPSAGNAPGVRRRLGSLDVSSVGLGVQNMTRTYQTTIPSRPEMINIIRSAFDLANHVPASHRPS